MNPWDLLWIILGWAAVAVVVLVIVTLLLIMVGVVVGLLKGNKTHSILSSRGLRKKRNE